jgi:hypothetical protein
MRNIVYIVGIVVLFTTSTSAQLEGNPANWCREGFFTRDSETFKIAGVKGGRNARVYFYDDDKENCPGSAACRRNTFVVGGDEVVVNRSFGGHSCAWYTPRSGRPTVGWIKTSDLEFNWILFDASTGPWLGEWKYGENAIEFTDNKLAGYLNVTGNATWIGANPGQVHVGELDGRYEPKNGIVNYSDGDDEYDCKVKMRLLGKYLIVADNLRCGGVNVSFSGVYTRKSK